MSFHEQFGKSNPRHAARPHRYTEQKARRARSCEIGCGGTIQAGDVYRRSLRTDQASCISCWEEKWPTT